MLWGPYPVDPARWRAPSFFARDAVPGEEPLDGAVAEAVAVLGKRLAQFLDGDVWHRFEKPEDQPCLRLDPA